MAARFLRVFENGARRAYPKAARRSAFTASHLEVRMFNVGDGEAILLTFPGRRAWLVDGGSSNSTPRNERLGGLLAGYLTQQQLVLEALVPSHPHKDHVGAVGPLLRAGPPLAQTVRYYYSGDPTWEEELPWLETLRDALDALGTQLEPVSFYDAHREVEIAAGVEARIFAGRGQGKYTSIFVHLRFHDARLLFTGDSYCTYERALMARYGEDHFRADVLKVTHHGSSSGTARTLVVMVRPGIAIASTADDAGHRLEADTLARLGGRPGRRAIFETVVDGDIILRTDGQPYGNGTLYQADFESPGRFAAAMEGGTLPLATVDAQRGSSNRYPECREAP